MTATASAQIASNPVAAPNPACSLCGREVTKRRRSLNGFGVCRKCWGSFVNRRQAAFLIDCVAFRVLGWLLTMGTLSLLSRTMNVRPSFVAIGAVALFASLLFAFKDGFWGYSLGKYFTGVQVVDMATREPASFWQSFKRNIHLSLPYVSIIPILVIGFGPWKGRRWGDRWAETMVVWRKHARKPPFNPISTVCIPCGYDLTGNVSGICPECGAKVELKEGCLHCPGCGWGLCM